MSAEPALRAPRDEDVPAIVELMNVVSRLEHGTDDMSEAELRSWFESPNVDVEHDVRVAPDEKGEIVAYGDIGDRADAHTRYWLDVRVHPSRDKDGVTTEALVSWAEARARETAVEGALMRAYVWSVNEPLKTALEGLGYRLVRHSYRMAIDVAGRTFEPGPPEGVMVRNVAPGEERAVYDVHQECFEDSWEHVREPYEEWEYWLVQRDFDSGLWFLACEGEELAGIALCREHESESDLGWVNILGVRRPWRRRGVGRALLEHAFAELASRGFARVGLGVDAESLTGAQRLYESAGMSVIRQADFYDKPLAL